MTTDQQPDNRLWHLFHKACQQWQLLEDSDHVLIGLSGGKDSLLLTELLGRQAKIYVPKIRVSAVHVRIAERKYLSDTSYLEHFCRQAGVSFQVIDTHIAGEEKKSPCFLCSWYRRKALFNYAQQTGCNKIAFGHHQDDVLNTMLMNLTFEGRCSSIPPRLPLDKMPLTLIRPLWLMPEADIRQYAQSQGYQTQKVLCPYDTATQRSQMHLLLREMEQHNPNARSSLLHALS